MGYEPLLVEAEPELEASIVEGVPVEELPGGLRESFAEADRRGVPVVLDFTAPG